MGKVNIKELNISYPTADAVKLFYKPLWVNDSLKSRFRLMPNVTSQRDLRFIGKLEKILKAYQGCNPVNTGGPAKITHRRVSVERMEFRLEMCADELIDALEEGARTFDKDFHDLTTSEFRQILIGLVQDAILNDVYRLGWFGNYNAAAQADAAYNFLTGWFNMFEALVTASSIGYANIVGLQGAALPANQAPIILKAMQAQQTEVMYRVSDLDKRFYVNRSVYQNLKEYYQGLGTEEAHRIQVGGQPTLSWDGIPVMLEDWDTELTSLIAADQHRAVLSMPDNLVVASDSGQTESEGISIWYDRETRLVKMEGFLKLDVNYVHEDFLVVAH